jgi:predicted GH43/DUF377 family glycosyl hydrolase
MVAVPVVRSDLRLEPDPRRRIVKAFLPGGRNPDDGRTRVEHILDRVLDMSAEDRSRTLAEVRARFDARHEDLDAVLRIGFRAVRHWIDHPAALSEDVRDLVGAYFVHEYSVEAAALTNPSLVPSPDQSDVPDGSLRVVVSLRAIGEGHISSVEFRTAVVGPEGKVVVEPARAPVPGTRRTPLFDKPLFTAKLHEVGADGGQGLIARVLDRLGESFTMEELESSLGQLDASDLPPTAVQHVSQTMHWLAASNYELVFPPTSFLSQRVIFPAGPTESRGMEDARFVRFEEGNGSAVYYATYTAYDGFTVLPQLIETADFRTFRIATLNGAAARNKGMTIFPRRVGGRFVALGRADNENNYVMFSDNVRFWHETELLQVPTRPWELVQIGNCGPPIETPEGWLVITHGVGPLRTYALGAILLDLDDPRRVIGHLPEPLLVPEEDERDGYVPNVVYSGGSLVHDGRLILAYGVSDTATRFATVPLDALLSELTSSSARAGTV